MRPKKSQGPCYVTELDMYCRGRNIILRVLQSSSGSWDELILACCGWHALRYAALTANCFRYKKSDMLSSTVFLISKAAASPYFSFHSASHCSSVFAAFFCSQLARLPPFRESLTYVLPRLKISRINSILVKALPLLENDLGPLLKLVVIPVQHIRVKIHSNALAVGAKDTLRVVQQIISIDQTDLRRIFLAGGDRSTFVCIWQTRLFILNESSFSGVIEKSSKLVISRLIWIIIMEPSHLLERWDGTAVERRNTGVRVADEECKVKLIKQIPGYDRGVARFALRRVGKGGLFAAAVSIDMMVAVHAVGAVGTTMAICPVDSVDPVGLATIGLTAVDPIHAIDMMITVDLVDPVGSICFRLCTNATFGWV